LGYWEGSQECRCREGLCLTRIRWREEGTTQPCKAPKPGGQSKEGQTVGPEE
jgi:hypothetical protein